MKACHTTHKKYGFVVGLYEIVNRQQKKIIEKRSTASLDFVNILISDLETEIKDLEKKYPSKAYGLFSENSEVLRIYKIYGIVKPL